MMNPTKLHVQMGKKSGRYIMRVDGLWPVAEANGDAVTIRETGKEIDAPALIDFLLELLSRPP